MPESGKGVRCPWDVEPSREPANDHGMLMWTPRNRVREWCTTSRNPAGVHPGSRRPRLTSTLISVEFDPYKWNRELR